MKDHVTCSNPKWHYEQAPNAKCLLLSKYGVAFFGPPTGEYLIEYIAWCPLPKRDKEREVKNDL